MRHALIVVFAFACLAGKANSAAGRVCAECHAKIARSFSSTPMALSSGQTPLGIPSSLDKISFRDRKSAFVYSVGLDRSGYYFRFRKAEQAEGHSEQRRLPYFIGSGAAAVAFLISVDGFLYEAPVTWYRRSGAWNLSPGYEDYSYPFLTRAVVPRCLDCHASGVQPIVGTQNGYGSPPFLEPGITCERCHGASDAHVGQMKSKSVRLSDAHILNPAKLEPDRRDSICAQCHLSGEVVVEKVDSRNRRFLPGDRLQEHRVSFARSSAGSQTRVTSHVENLSQSGCKRASGDRLWCGSCHNAHSVPVPAQKAEWFRSKCLACHASSACVAPVAARHAADDNCVSCHMPKNLVSDAQHVAATDHSIPRWRAKREPGKNSAQETLVPFGQAKVEARELGLAYAIAAARNGNAADADRGFALLKQAAIQLPNDPQVLSYLADLYKKRSDHVAAIALYQELLQADPADVSAPVALGGYALERGDIQEAIRLWNNALKKSPALLLVRANLAAAFLRSGQPERARTVLTKALQFNPNFAAARELLNQIPP